MELIEKAKGDAPTVLVTHDGDRMSARCMMCQFDNFLGYYYVTRTESRKLAEIKKNNDCLILFGKKDTMSSDYAEARARAFPTTDPWIRRLAWRDFMKTYGYTGVDDPNLVVILLVIDTVIHTAMATFQKTVVNIPRPRILITGASGHNGKRIAEFLLKTHMSTVRVALRDVSKGKEFAAMGAEVVNLDWEKKPTIAPAFAGVDRVFFMAPMTLSWVDMCRSALDAAKAAGVKHFVSMAAIGAKADAPMWLMAEHGKCEDLVKASGIPFTILEPTFFADNFVNYDLQGIKEKASVFGSAGDGRTSYIAVDDIAHVAAVVLIYPPPHVGKTMVLTGPKAISMVEAAEAISKVAGKKVSYVDMPPDAYKKMMIEHAKMPEKLAQGFLDLQMVKKNGWSSGVTETVKQVTGHDPITFEQYLEKNKAAFK